MRKSFLAAAVATAVTVAVFAASSGTQRPVTIGQFAVKVSRAMGNASANQSVAVSSLKKLGVNLGTDLNASLTEGQAARIMSDLGLRVTTAHPDSAMTSGKADQLAGMAGSASVASLVPADFLIPPACLQQRNRGQCDTCCTNYLISINIDPNTTPACARACKVIPPPGKQSPSEPVP
jgi:hypothetical protein